MNTPAYGHTTAAHARFQPKAMVSTPEQQAIQTATERLIIIEANAGAAKTTTLALRMAETWVRGVRPEQILALTYTATACGALKAALRKMGLPVPVISRFQIQTFESFCTGVLNEMVGGAVPVWDQAEQLKSAVWAAIQDVEDSDSGRWPDALVLPSLGSLSAVEEFVRVNRWLKGTLCDDLQRQERQLTPDYAADIGVDYTQLKIFRAYERLRRREGAEKPLFRGAEDATYDLARLLHEGEEPLDGLQSWPWALQTLLVDEMHDMNQAMFIVLEKLLSTTRSFFCGVGDRDQVIYDATGADAVFMGEVLGEKTGQPVKRYPLSSSFRFGQALAVKAGRFAGKPYSAKAEHDTRVVLSAYDTPGECADRVVEAALDWKAQPQTRMDEFAVLLRHSCQSVALENGLLAQNLPYTMSGFDSYLMRPEVLFVRGLLAIATDSFASVANDKTREKVMLALVSFTGITIEVAGREQESQETLLKDAIHAVTQAPGFLLNFFENQVLRNAAPSMRSRLKAAIQVAQAPCGADTLERLLKAVDMPAMVNEVFVSQQRRLDAHGNLAGLQQAAAQFGDVGRYFQSLNDAEQKQVQLRKSASLVIASVANVKGLEFEHVVLPYLERGQFPQPSAAAKEEQNMFYVGVTRARRCLTLLVRRDAPSPFVLKMGYKPSAPTPAAAPAGAPAPPLNSHPSFQKCSPGETPR